MKLIIVCVLIQCLLSQMTNNQLSQPTTKFLENKSCEDQALYPYVDGYRRPSDMIMNTTIDTLKMQCQEFCIQYVLNNYMWESDNICCSFSQFNYTDIWNNQYKFDACGVNLNPTQYDFNPQQDAPSQYFYFYYGSYKFNNQDGGDIAQDGALKL